MTGISHFCLQMATPVADHLWQSTVFALLAACLTLLLRSNPARHRFNLWLIASLKFLLPFAALARLGHALRPAVFTTPPATFAFAIDLAGHPFHHAASRLSHPTWRDYLPDTIALPLAILWAFGTAIVLARWWWRWRQVSRTRTASTPLTHGVEVDLIRSLAPAVGSRALPVLLAASRIEPGVFGLFRPVLLWPAGLSQQLQQPQLQAILAHELWHARRRDNFTAALQLSIQALFWFHPLIWWLGAHQLQQRELACDEGVLALGSEPAAYAEGILKACRFCLESPLPCVAGVHGSNLNRRIKHIMKNHHTTTLSISRKLVLGSLAITTLAAPMLVGAASNPGAAMQAAGPENSGPVHMITLKRSTATDRMTLINHPADQPNSTAITNITVGGLIQLAYSLKPYQLTGGPAWLDQDRFDLTFTGGAPSPSLQDVVSNAALKQILSQQFHLVLQQQTKPGPVFALVVSAGGPKFVTATPPNAPGTSEPLLSQRSLIKDGQGQVTITGGPGGLADVLSPQLGRPILDNTGLTGIYSIAFHWATASASAQSISTDLQQQLGLSLIPQRGPVESSVVESVTLPQGL